MLISGNRLPGGITLRSEVCIIGTGPAGLTIARELREAGIRVILLESGDRRTHGPANELLRGESVGYPFPLEASRRRAFGGTSSHWTAETGLRVRPLDAVDLESRSVNGGVGWPISPAELAPYYERAMGSL
ncbi:MAG: FAD-dependent oxidoreductase, partial [Hyphomicrobiales bacterium]